MHATILVLVLSIARTVTCDETAWVRKTSKRRGAANFRSALALIPAPEYMQRPANYVHVVYIPQVYVGIKPLPARRPRLQFLLVLSAPPS
jgi:hypothetical protein